MGGQRRKRQRFKNKKTHQKGNRVNDPQSFRLKRKRAVFHSIEDDLDAIDFP